MGSNQYWAGRVYDLCVYFMTGTHKGSTKSGFKEKPGIESLLFVAFPWEVTSTGPRGFMM